MYFTDAQAYCVESMIECPGMRFEVMEKSWRERGSMAYWCPVLKRFISEGEKYRLQHWFHNGDGSAQQRYYYNQFEMLDMHGGLDKIPTTITSSNTTSIRRDDDDESVCFMGVSELEEVITRKRQKAEANGEVVNVDYVQDGKMPAKKQRTW
jgi:hypothetical protein